MVKVLFVISSKICIVELREQHNLTSVGCSGSPISIKPLWIILKSFGVHNCIGVAFTLSGRAVIRQCRQPDSRPSFVCFTAHLRWDRWKSMLSSALPTDRWDLFNNDNSNRFCHTNTPMLSNTVQGYYVIICCKGVYWEICMDLEWNIPTK